MWGEIRRFNGALSAVRLSNLLAAACIASSAHAGGMAPYTEEAASRGLVYQIQNYPQTNGAFGFGCGFVDLDNDGDQDVVALGALGGEVGVFENDGSGSFIDRSAQSGIPTLPESSSFAAADYDGDGDVDLYFTQVGWVNVLMRNDGDFHFTDVTDDAGIGDDGPGFAPNWGDFDNDGWLDVYVCNYNGQTDGSLFHDNKLYRNLGNGSFEEVSAAQNVDSDGYSFQAVWFDYDRDNDVDLYISNDRGHLSGNPNELYRNDDGQLVDISAQSGADVGIFSMGLACGDFDNNGFPDLYCTNIDTPGALGGINPLLLNQGDGTFIEDAVNAGVAQYVTSWGSVFHDYDNNKWLDLYVNNMFEPNMMHHNNGSFPCTEQAGPLDIQAPSEGTSISYCAAVGDVDGDGDLDLLVSTLSNPLQLFINHEGDQFNALRLRVAGVGPNTFAIGGSVDAKIGDVWQYREIYAGGNGYLGQNELTVHIGAGSASAVEEVVVQWPSGGPSRTLTDVPINETFTVYPPVQLGDANSDDAVNLDDFLVLAGCFNQTIEPGCEMMDFNGDSTVDVDDYLKFEAVYDAALIDCNNNDVVDMLEILNDPSIDLDNNGLIDACPSIPGDFDDTGTVNYVDLNMLLDEWGPCPNNCQSACEIDLDGDCVVNVPDLLILLANWG